MALIERLYQTGTLPQNAKLATIKQVESVLALRLVDKLTKGYHWFAACTVAVEAGRYGAQRRIKSRRKLLSLINVCRKARNVQLVSLPKGWEHSNMIYGYGAYNVDRHSIINDTLNVISAIAETMLQDHR